jgi:asparagine synthase (glutamine-hydrolysing)
VCQLARESVTVALSGDGADEAFAGYRRHLFHAGEDRVRSILPQSIRGSVFGTLGRIYPKADWAPRPLRAKTTLLSLAESGPAAYARALSYTTPEQRASLHGPELRERLGDYRANDALERLMHNAPARDGLDAAQYADLKMWLPGDILTKVDRASMAVSLEAREPLLDHRLVEFAAALPRKGRIRGTQGKALMKKAMERYLPADILYRQKQGFVVPIAQWFRGPLRDEVNALPTSARSVRAGWFERQSLADIVARHLEGKADNSRLIWQIIMLEHSMKNMELDALN